MYMIVLQVNGCDECDQCFLFVIHAGSVILGYNHAIEPLDPSGISNELMITVL